MITVDSPKVFIKLNHIGWVHLWNKQEDYELGEPSIVFFNGNIDPLWLEILESLSDEIRKDLLNGIGMILTDDRFLNF